MSNAYSSAETLTRVIIEQAANQLYISLDEGARARALLRSSKALTQKNGKNWVAYLDSQGVVSSVANVRRNNGEKLLTNFDKKWPHTESYPNVKQLFEVLGWGNHYHSFYAPLCDSVHSYSDDMANLVMLYEMSGVLKDDLILLMQATETERRRLATYHFVVAVGLRSEVLTRICERLSIETPIETLQPSFNDLQKVISNHESYDHRRL